MVFSKVLSFVEFVNENYSNIESINEEKNFFIPTREDIIGVLDIQKKLRDNSKYKKNPNKLYKGVWGSLDEFNSLNKSLQDKAISDIQKSFEKLKISEKSFNEAVGLLEKNLKSGSASIQIKYSEVNQNFYIIISKEKIEKPKENPEKPVPSQPKEEKFSIVDPLKTSYFFKNNMYEIKEDNLAETFTDPEYIKQMLDLIDDKIAEGYEFYKENKKPGITKIDIEASCSRFRNTGPAGTLSWVDLAYRRTLVFSKYIKYSAEKVSNNDEGFVNAIMGITTLGYFGSNGDGTSGPDPDKNEKGEKVRKGYYIKEGDQSKFVDSKESDPIMINVLSVKMGENASPILTGPPKIVKAKDNESIEMTKAPLTPKEYDPFRYFQISMEGIFLASISDQDPTIQFSETPMVITEEKYSVSVAFPKKIEKTSPPRRTQQKTKQHKSSKKPGIKRIPCPWAK